MKFVNLAAAVNAHYDNAREKFAADVETLTAAAALDSWYYRVMMTPAATVRAWHRVTTGAASGCGYDKQSAAIASAMNGNPEILRILYDHAENGGSFPYSVHTFAGLPSFDGGCGVSCFRSVFAACGYTWRDVASGKTFDAYTLEPAEVSENV